MNKPLIESIQPSIQCKVRRTQATLCKDRFKCGRKSGRKLVLGWLYVEKS